MSSPKTSAKYVSRKHGCRWETPHEKARDEFLFRVKQREIAEAYRCVKLD
jgi:hypothetical protein